MRVRLHERSAAVALAAAVERAGGSAFVIGETIELVHPSGDVTAHSLRELEFFVRAWAVAEGVEQHVPVPLEILG